MAEGKKNNLTPKQRKRRQAERKQIRKDKRQQKINQRALDGRTDKQNVRRARRTVNAAYRPDAKALRNEQKHSRAVYNKRTRDNEYYMQWVGDRMSELDTNARAADAATQQSLAQLANDTIQTYENSNAQMIQNAEAGVTDPNTYSGFTGKSTGQIASARQQTDSSLGTAVVGDAAEFRTGALARVADAMGNRALQAGADWQKDRRTIRESREKLRLERRRDTIAESVRLFDQEIEKAKIRNDIRVSNKELKLRRSAMLMDARQSNLDRAAENKRNAADNRTSRQNTKDNNKAKGGGGKDRDEVLIREKKKLTRAYNAGINSALQRIQNLPKYNDIKMAADRASRDKMYRTLKKDGIPENLIPAVIDIFKTGSLSRGTKASLKTEGYIVPKRWR